MKLPDVFSKLATSLLHNIQAWVLFAHPFVFNILRNFPQRLARPTCACGLQQQSMCCPSGHCCSSSQGLSTGSTLHGKAGLHSSTAVSGSSQFYTVNVFPRPWQGELPWLVKSWAWNWSWQHFILMSAACCGQPAPVPEWILKKREHVGVSIILEHGRLSL